MKKVLDMIISQGRLVAREFFSVNVLEKVVEDVEECEIALEIVTLLWTVNFVNV